MARLFTWFPADGSAPLVLNDRASGYRLMQQGTIGLNSPPYRFATSQQVGIDGALLNAVNADPRLVSLSLTVEASDESTFRARWRTLVRGMRPKRGPGQLQVSSEDGTTRTLSAFYLSGLEGDGGDMFDGAQGRASVKLMALDPWFYGSIRTINFGLAAPTPFFPITPVVLSSSNIQGSLTVDLSDADAPSFPVWTVTGPGSALTLTNVTTGRSIQITTPIGDGQTVVMDTRPGMQSVRDGNGNNLMGSLASDPALWPLVEGVNQVSALLAGAGPASSISGVYAPSYSGI